MKNIMGEIFISGGGDSKDSFFLDKKFINALIKRKILYIPIALERDKIGFEACYDWIINTLSQHSSNFIDITMLLDLYDKNLEIKDYGGIYIGGGNTYKLLQYIYDSHFDKIIRNFLNNGGIIYGGSAGAIIFGKNIATIQEENNGNYKYNNGLSLLGDYSILCHYTGKEDENIIKFIKQYNSPVIALSENSGLIIDNTVTEVVGNGVAIFDLKGRKIYKQENNYIKDIYLK